jgi:hypothetical protein
MSEPQTFYPVGWRTGFGYDVELHAWTLNGVQLSEAEALRIFVENMIEVDDTTAQQEVPTVVVDARHVPDFNVYMANLRAAHPGAIMIDGSTPGEE